MLTEYSSDLANFYKNGTHLVSFKDEIELLKKIKYYLLNKKKREEIANSAFDFYKKNYSYNKIGSKLSELFSIYYKNLYFTEKYYGIKHP